MTMHNPPHPGDFTREVYLEPFGISSRQLASSLGVSPSTLSRWRGLRLTWMTFIPWTSRQLNQAVNRKPKAHRFGFQI